MFLVHRLVLVGMALNRGIIKIIFHGILYESDVREDFGENFWFVATCGRSVTDYSVNYFILVEKWSTAVPLL